MFVKYYNPKKHYQAPTPDSSWEKHNEVMSFRFMRLVNYLLIALVLILYGYLLINHKEQLDSYFQYFNSLGGVAGLFTGIVLYVVIHECIHLSVMPAPNWSKHEGRYFTTKGTLVAVFYMGEISTKRYMLMVLSPFLVLSFILIPMAILSSGYISSVAWILVITHFGACAYDFKIILNLLPMAKYKGMFLGKEGVYFR